MNNVLVIIMCNCYKPTDLINTNNLRGNLKGRVLLEQVVAGKVGSKNWALGFSLDSTASEQTPLSFYCKYGNGHSNFIYSSGSVTGITD
jgi:hypothetical protein